MCVPLYEKFKVIKWTFYRRISWLFLFSFTQLSLDRCHPACCRRLTLSWGLLLCVPVYLGMSLKHSLVSQCPFPPQLQNTTACQRHLGCGSSCDPTPLRKIYMVRFIFSICIPTFPVITTAWRDKYDSIFHTHKHGISTWAASLNATQGC